MAVGCSEVTVFLLTLVLSAGAHDPTGLGHLLRWKPVDLPFPFHFRLFIEENPDFNEIFPRTQEFIRSTKGLDWAVDVSGPEYLCPNATYKPYWTSNIYLIRELFKLDIDIYQVLKRFNSTTDHSLLQGTTSMALDHYLNDVETSSIRAMKVFLSKNPSTTDSQSPYLQLTSNPLLIYRIIRRYAQDLHLLVYQISKSDLSLVATIMMLVDEAMSQDSMLPTQEDLEEALFNLIRVQTANIFNTFSLAGGKFKDVTTPVAVNCLHALEIGTFFVRHEIFDVGLQWLHAALQILLWNENVAQHYPEVGNFIKATMEMATVAHNNARESCGAEDMDLFTEPVAMPFQPELYTQTVFHLNPGMHWMGLMDSKMYRVCSGENLQSEEVQKQVTCWLETRGLINDGYNLINPIKIEILNLSPPVIQFHEIISDRLIEEIKVNSYKKLVRKVEPTVRMWDKHDVQRTGGAARFQDGGLLKSLKRNLERLSGTWFRDDYTVNQYIPGQYFDLHLDGTLKDKLEAIPSPDDNDYDYVRVATAIGYLDDIHVGGKTGFPQLGFAVTPYRGSVALWYNVNREGKDDLRLWHGECPVALGVKWTITKYAYDEDNDWILPND